MGDEEIVPTPATPEPVVVTTPQAKATVHIKPFMDGFADEAIQKALMGGYRMKMTVDPSKGAQAAQQQAQEPRDVEIDGSATIEAERARISQMVISVNGDASDVVTSIYRLPVADKNFVLEEIKKIAQPFGDETPDTPPTASNPAGESPADREKKA